MDIVRSNQKIGGAQYYRKSLFLLFPTFLSLQFSLSLSFLPSVYFLLLCLQRMHVPATPAWTAEQSPTRVVIVAATVRMVLRETLAKVLARFSRTIFWLVPFSSVICAKLIEVYTCTKLIKIRSSYYPHNADRYSKRTFSSSFLPSVLFPSFFCSSFPDFNFFALPLL